MSAEREYPLRRATKLLRVDRDDALREAEKLLRQGRLDDAIKLYQNVIKKVPDDWTAANALGDLYVRAGSIEDAAAEYTRIADHFLEEGFLPKAVALYKKILRMRPDDETCRLRLGEIAAQQGLVVDADASLPGPAAPAAKTASTPATAERFGEFRQAVSEQSAADLAAQQYKLAITYRDMGMLDEAVTALELASRSPAHRFASAAALGRLHRDRDTLERAIYWFERAAEAPAPSLEEGRALLYELGDVLERTLERARSPCSSNCRRMPESIVMSACAPSGWHAS